VLELSLREALSLGHNYIGTEHILLGLVRENEDVGAQILREQFDLDAEKIRNEIIRILSGPGAREQQQRVDPDLERKLLGEYAGTMVQSHTLRHTLRQLPQRPARAEWPSILTGALLLGLGILVGWLIWG
jgi:ATP-dependent Clp protease ATP-binding subunit ClpA